MDDSSSQPLLYQALGVVTGRLQYIPGLQCSLLLEDGRSLRISDLKGKVKAWLKNYPEALETTRSWGIYPRTDREGVLTHAGLHAWRNQLCPTRFKIVGDLAYQAPGTVTIRICRNVPPPEGKDRHLAWKPFFLTLRGDLPDANLREGWQMHGEIEGEQIRITVAEKLKDAPSSRKRQTGFKKPQRVATQTDAAVSQRGDLAPCREDAEPTPLKPEPREQPDLLQSQPILEPMSTIDSISPSTAPEANPDSSKPTEPSAPQKAVEASSGEPSPGTSSLPNVQAPQPKFMVQVDRRHYPGQVSVHLKAGLLLIDGKRIAQTKLVIVIGEPQQMSTDGKAQKSGNRTILSSR